MISEYAEKRFVEMFRLADLNLHDPFSFNIAYLSFIFEDDDVQNNIFDFYTQVEFYKNDHVVYGTDYNFSPTYERFPKSELCNKLLYLASEKKSFYKKLNGSDLILLYLQMFHLGYQYWVPECDRLTLTNQEPFTSHFTRHLVRFKEVADFCGVTKFAYPYLVWCYDNLIYEKYTDIEDIKKQYQIESVIT